MLLDRILLNFVLCYISGQFTADNIHLFVHCNIDSHAYTNTMNAEEFQLRAKEVVNYVADYLENIRQRRPLPNVAPGYLKALVPETAPDDPEEWEDVFGDFERVIMPGVRNLCKVV